MGAIEDRTDVQWLFGYMNNATVMGELKTVQTIILLEQSDENEYTRDEDIMQRLRDCFRKNADRIQLV